MIRTHVFDVSRNFGRGGGGNAFFNGGGGNGGWLVVVVVVGGSVGGDCNEVQFCGGAFGENPRTSYINPG